MKINILEKIDLFSIQTFNLFKDKKNVSSLFSQIISSWFIMYFLYQGYLQYSLVKGSSDYILQRSILLRDPSQSVELNSTNFIFAINFNNANFTLEHRKYVDLKIYTSTYNYTINDFLPNTYFNLLPCTSDYFPDSLRQQFNNLGLDTALCPTRFSIDLIQSSNLIAYLKVELKICNKAEGIECQGYNNTQFLQNYTDLWIQFYWVESISQPQNLQEPHLKQIQLYDVKFRPDQDQTVVPVAYLKQEFIEKDDRFFDYLQEIQITTNIHLAMDQFKQRNIYVPPDEEYKTLVLFKFRLNPNIFVINAIFPDFLDLLQRLFGSCFFIYLFLAFITDKYNTQYYKALLIKEIYPLKITPFSIFSLKNQLSDYQLKNGMKGISVKTFISTYISLEQTRQIFYSKKHWLMLRMISQPFDSLSTLMSKYNKINDKDNEQKMKEQEKNFEGLTRQQIQKKQQFKTLDGTQMNFQEYLNNLKNFNRQNLLNNIFDMMVEKYIQDYFKEKFRYEIEYDQREKMIKIINTFKQYPIDSLNQKIEDDKIKAGQK